MPNTRRRWCRRLAYAVGGSACLTLAFPAIAAEGAVQSGQPSAPAAADQQATTTISALIAKLETQIAADHITTPPNDSAADTLAAIVNLIPKASLADVEMVVAMPSRFTKREGMATTISTSADDAFGMRFTMAASVSAAL